MEFDDIVAPFTSFRCKTLAVIVLERIVRGKGERERGVI